MAKSNDNDILTIIDDEPEEAKPRKRAKAAQDEPSSDSFRSEKDTGVRHFASAQTADAVPGREGEVRFFSESEQKSRPSLEGYQSKQYEENSLGGLYSDSGKTVCMVLRLVSYLLFLLAPISVIGDMFAVFGSSEPLDSGVMISSVISSLVSAVLLVVGGFLVIAVIKILQNLMALKKKK